MKGKSRMSRKKEEKNNEERTDNTTVEETAVEESAELPVSEEVNPLQQALDEANAKAAEYLALAQRVQADFENFRKRNETIRADAYADGRKDTAALMLPVLDNLERAVEAAAGSKDEALKNGVEMVLKQMTDTYGKMDVKPIDRKGEKFDPNLENAIMQGTAEDGEPGTVCQVLQKGYMIGDKVLRHAMVKVVPE
jgi:molecular chaperone GrpE